MIHLGKSNVSQWRKSNELWAKKFNAIFPPRGHSFLFSPSYMYVLNGTTILVSDRDLVKSPQSGYRIGGILEYLLGMAMRMREYATLADYAHIR